MRTLNKPAIAMVLVTAVLSWSHSHASAEGFGELGVGTQVLVVDGDQGSQRGIGFTLRSRFLWVLGLDFTATSVETSDEIWMPSAYRLGLMLHPWHSEHFDFYLNPGLAGDTLGDMFNPNGNTTWFRLGGGAEVRFRGFALGFEMHWTMPGEESIHRYLDEYGEELMAQYLMSLGQSQDIPASIPDVSPMELLRFLPLDRLEFTIGARYYF